MKLIVFLNKIITPNNRIKALLSLLVPAFVIITRPINLTGNQSIILGSLFLVIVWMATGWVNREAACTVLIISFLIFGNVPATDVFNFPLSETMLMIVAAFLLSSGVINSKITEQFSELCIRHFCRKGIHLILLSFILAALLIFIIPHSFPRAILMTAIYISFFDKCKLEADKRPVFLFGIFVAITATTPLLLNGDVTNNFGAFVFAGTSISFTDFARNMFLPSLGNSILVFFAYILTFRKELNISFPKDENPIKLKLSRDSVKALFIMLIVIVLWVLEPLHGISSARIAVIGAGLMFLLRLISLKDVKNLNYGLLWFLTAMFAIGRTLIGSGTAEKIRDAISPLLPTTESFWFLPAIVFIIIFLHMIMGSVSAIFAVSIPMVIFLTEGIWSREFVAMLVLCSVVYHYILPFHQGIIMVGYGSGYFDNRHTLKFSPLLTLVVLISLFFFYVPWWRYLGI